RFSAFEDAEDIEHQRAEGGTLGQLGRNAERAVQRNARTEQRRDFLREEQNIAAMARLKRRQSQLDPGLLLIQPDIDRNETLTAQFRSDTFVRLGRESAGPNLAV